MLTQEALEGKDDIEGADRLKEDLTEFFDPRDRVKARALETYRGELHRPVSRDLGLHGVSRASLRTLCKAAVIQSSKLTKKKYAQSMVSSAMQEIHEEKNAINALRMLKKERLVVSRLGFPDRAMELDLEIEVMNEKAKEVRREQEEEMLEYRMKVLAMSQQRKEQRLEYMLAEETRLLEESCKAEENKCLQRQEAEFVRVLESATRRAVGKVKKCACTVPYLCRHNKTASYNTRRPSHIVVQYRRNAKRLKQAGRPDEAAVWTEKANVLDDQEQEKWRVRVANSIVSSPWGANEAAVDQVTELHKRELAVLHKTHAVMRETHDKRHAMRRKTFQNTILAEVRKVRMQCRKQALLRQHADCAEEHKEEVRKRRLSFQSEGLLNVSRNLLGDDGDSPRGYDENGAEIKAAAIDWVPPAAFGLDNSVRLVDAAAEMGMLDAEQGGGRILTSLNDIKNLNAEQMREKIQRNMQSFGNLAEEDCESSYADSEHTHGSQSSDHGAEGAGQDYVMGQTSGSKLVDRMRKLNADRVTRRSFSSKHTDLVAAASAAATAASNDFSTGGAEDGSTIVSSTSVIPMAPFQTFTPFKPFAWPNASTANSPFAVPGALSCASTVEFSTPSWMAGRSTHNTGSAPGPDSGSAPSAAGGRVFPFSTGRNPFAGGGFGTPSSFPASTAATEAPRQVTVEAASGATDSGEISSALETPSSPMFHTTNLGIPGRAWNPTINTTSWMTAAEQKSPVAPSAPSPSHRSYRAGLHVLSTTGTTASPTLATAPTVGTPRSDRSCAVSDAGSGHSTHSVHATCPDVTDCATTISPQQLQMLQKRPADWQFDPVRDAEEPQFKPGSVRDEDWLEHDAQLEKTNGYENSYGKLLILSTPTVVSALALVSTPAAVSVPPDPATPKALIVASEATKTTSPIQRSAKAVTSPYHTPPVRGSALFIPTISALKSVAVKGSVPVKTSAHNKKKVRFGANTVRVFHTETSDGHHGPTTEAVAGLSCDGDDIFPTALLIQSMARADASDAPVEEAVAAQVAAVAVEAVLPSATPRQAASDSSTEFAATDTACAEAALTMTASAAPLQPSAATDVLAVSSINTQPSPSWQALSPTYHGFGGSNDWATARTALYNSTGYEPTTATPPDTHSNHTESARTTSSVYSAAFLQAAAEGNAMSFPPPAAAESVVSSTADSFQAVDGHEQTASPDESQQSAQSLVHGVVHATAAASDVQPTERSVASQFFGGFSTVTDTRSNAAAAPGTPVHDCLLLPVTADAHSFKGNWQGQWHAPTAGGISGADVQAPVNVPRCTLVPVMPAASKRGTLTDNDEPMTERPPDRSTIGLPLAAHQHDSSAVASDSAQGGDSGYTHPAVEPATSASSNADSERTASTESVPMAISRSSFSSIIDVPGASNTSAKVAQPRTSPPPTSSVGQFEDTLRAAREHYLRDPNKALETFVTQDEWYEALQLYASFVNEDHKGATASNATHAPAQAAAIVYQDSEDTAAAALLQQLHLLRSWYLHRLGKGSLNDLVFALEESFGVELYDVDIYAEHMSLRCSKYMMR